MTGLLGHKLHRIFSILLIIVMTAILINKVVYTHIHIQASGSIVAHAHPFSKKTHGHPGSGHHHSGAMLFLLDQLDVMIWSMTAVLMIVQCTWSASLIEPVMDRLLPAFVPLLPGRSPPFYM
jgi:hypothetical protein